MLAKFIDLASFEASKSLVNKKMGAILIYRNKVVSSAHNIEKKISTNNKLCIL